MSSDFLMKVADVLDSVADEKSKLAGELSQIKEARRKEVLEPVVEKLSFVTGEDSDEIQRKLAQVDDSVLGLIQDLTGVGGNSLGSSGTKTASVEMGRAALGAKADSDFANWILS